jgi:hypothetical protein
VLISAVVMVVMRGGRRRRSVMQLHRLTVRRVEISLAPSLLALADFSCRSRALLPDNGFQRPRGSTMVYDDEHLALWERGRGSTTDQRTFTGSWD